MATPTQRMQLRYVHAPPPLMCHSPGALLKIEIRHFDGPVFPYILRAPHQYTSFYLVRNSRAGEVESLPWSTLCSLLISTLDRSNLQTFRRWKPYLYPVFYQSIPESRAPKVETEEGKAGIYKALALLELGQLNSRDRQVIRLFCVCLSMEEALFRITITFANFLQKLVGLRF